VGRRRNVKVSASRTAALDANASPPSPWWPIAIIVLMGCLAYSNTLHNPFIFDDHYSVVENEQIRDIANLGAVFTPVPESPVAGRPIVNLTFAANYALGGLDVTGYHVWNITTHLLTALLFFGILRRTLTRQAGWLRDKATPLACAAAVLWTVHPLTTDAVDYITQRTELTMGALLLLTMYASLRALASRRRGAWSTLAVLACALGMASKETMVTAPVLVVLYDRIFAFPSWRDAWAARWRLYAGLFATWSVLAALLATSPRSGSAGFSSGVSPLVYLFNQFPIVARYLGLAFWPHSLVQNYGWPEPVAIAAVLPFIALVGGLVLITIAAFRWAPKIAFLGAWIWITLAPASSVVPIATEVGAERRMYLPLLAVVTLVVLGAAAILRRVDWRVELAAVAAVARNRDYATPLAIAETTVARRPTPVARHALATELLAVGQRDAALAQLYLAVDGAPRARYTLGVELIERGQTDAGIAQLQSFIQAEPQLHLAVSAHEYLGNTYAQRHEWAKAEAEFQAMLDLNTSDAPAERLLADAYLSDNNLDAAIAHYQRYLGAVTTDFDAYNQMGAALGSKGRLDDALAAFTQAEQLNPQNGPVERNLAYLLYQKRDFAGARLHAERAVALEPGDEVAQSLLHTLKRMR
jgi:tetratricopeptide (TPR) repeat protein